MATYAKFFSLGGGGSEGTLQVQGGLPLSASLQRIEDQVGNLSPLQLSTDEIGVSKSSTATTQDTAVIKSTDTNAGIAIVPNGNGAFTLQVPDGTGAGGNARGDYAVDLQTKRGSTKPADIASGTGSSIIGGYGNQASGDFSVSGGGNSEATGNYSVAFGQTNSASGSASVVSGGYLNAASGSESGVVSGRQNQATGYRSFIGGGFTNVNSSTGGTISGGQYNTASTNSQATVVGGSGNTSTGQYSVSGGSGNTASGLSSVALGENNTASGPRSVALGRANSAGEYSIVAGNANSGTGTGSVVFGYNNNSGSRNYATILGGLNNTISTNTYATVVGGQSNTSSGSHSITGGSGNTASGTAAVAFGYSSTASGDRSFAMGNQTYATADYSFAFGERGKSYLHGQVSQSTMNYFHGNSSPYYGTGQASTLTAWRFNQVLSSGDSTVLTLNGSGTAELLIPDTDKLWAAKITATAAVSANSGTTLVNGDSYMAEYTVLFKKVGGTSSVVGTNAGNIIHDTNMAGATFTFAAGASQDLQITFNAPTAASADTFRCVAKVELVETAF
jgi:hypothetical protein